MSTLKITRSGSTVSVNDRLDLRMKDCRTPVAAMAFEEVLKVDHAGAEQGFRHELDFPTQKKQQD
ncbi:MAG: hypothetical protein WCF85_22075 [Rhodospirillaceae bacterium]